MSSLIDGLPAEGMSFKVEQGLVKILKDSSAVAQRQPNQTSDGVRQKIQLAALSHVLDLVDPDEDSGALQLSAPNKLALHFLAWSVKAAHLKAFLPRLRAEITQWQSILPKQANGVDSKADSLLSVQELGDFEKALEKLSALSAAYELAVVAEESKKMEANLSQGEVFAYLKVSQLAVKELDAFSIFTRLISRAVIVCRGRGRCDGKEIQDVPL